MKRLLLSLIIFLLFIPCLVFAEECDITKISITSMDQSSIVGKTEVISEPIIKDRNVNFNLKMHDVGDSISYNMTINNASNYDYMIDENTFKTDSEYIEYSLETKDGNNVVKANSSKKVVLSIIYKKEVDQRLFKNNKYNADNELKLSLNSDKKEKKLSIITTNNVKNPNTGNHIVIILLIVVIFSIIFIQLIIHNKKFFVKCLLLILPILTIPIVYAVCKCEINVESNIEIERLATVYETIGLISDEDNSCITKYEGDVTDEVGKTVPATNVYFNNCPDKRNVIFGGQCWQIIRTTETKGIKMLYNGEPNDGKCESSRENHNGIVSKGVRNLELTETYLYGSSFSYDVDEKTFTLEDTTNNKWSDSTYKSIIGKYTCKSNSNKCSKLYSINDYYSNEIAISTSYEIEPVNYSTIGTSPFNANTLSASAGGYMFNKSYNLKKLHYTLVYDDYVFGEGFTYNNETGKYTLTNTVGPFKGMDNMSRMATHHYTCWNTNGTCEKISYIIYIQASNYHFIELENGEGIEQALTNMFSSNEVNKYDSSIKGIIDNWYGNNFNSYTSYLENNTYCNDRTITSLGGWNSSYGPLYRGTSNILKFKGYDRSGENSKNISCNNITDQFSTANNKAKLKYPIGLFSFEELNNIENSDLLKSNIKYWTMSLSDYEYYFGTWAVITNQNGSPRASLTPTDGILHHGNSIDTDNGIRPAITLKENISILKGTGSEVDPWIVK